MATRDGRIYFRALRKLVFVGQAVGHFPQAAFGGACFSLRSEHSSDPPPFQAAHCPRVSRPFPPRELSVALNSALISASLRLCGEFTSPNPPHLHHLPTHPAKS